MKCELCGHDSAEQPLNTRKRNWKYTPDFVGMCFEWAAVVFVGIPLAYIAILWLVLTVKEWIGAVL